MIMHEFPRVGIIGRLDEDALIDYPVVHLRWCGVAADLALSVDRTAIAVTAHM